MAIDLEPLWRVRLRLAVKSFRKNWALFSQNRIGLVGLVIIGAFAAMAILHPWLLFGFGTFRTPIIGLFWLFLTWVTYRSLQTQGGIVTLVSMALFGVAAVLMVAAGWARTPTLIIFFVWLAIARLIVVRFKPLAKTPAMVVAIIIGLVLGWGLVSMADVWEPRTFNPVIGVELNPPVHIKTVVNEVTNPDTEISFREALFDYPLATLGDTIEIRRQPAPPDGRHLLGTDPLGRDVLSQLMYGSRAAFFLGIVAALVTVLFATTVGAVAAYYGGLLDSFFMRLADLLLMLPILAILIVANSVFKPALWHLATIIGLISGFGGTAIILKSQALSVKVKPFIDAARVAGGSSTRIIFTHIVPNVIPLSFLYMMFTVTGAIQTEAALSFLGLINLDMSWGIMIQISQTQGYLLQGTSFWWLLIPAGFAVTLLAAAFFLVGRGMDEVINPRLRGR
jgi:peptide/nickel transport system permease protein